MTERVILIDGIDYIANSDVPIKVSPTGIATINKAHQRGVLAVIEIGGTAIVEFAPNEPHRKPVPLFG